MESNTIVRLGSVQGVLLDLSSAESTNRFVFEAENSPALKTLLDACTDSRIDASNVNKVAVYLDDGDIEAVARGALPVDIHRQLLATADGQTQHYTLDLRKLSEMSRQ